MNLYDYLLANGKTNQAALLTPAETTTYGQLKAEAEAIAARLTAIGIHTGDRVAIFAENSAFWVASYLGIIKIGAVAVPAPARLNPRQITELLDMTGTTALCADERRLKQTRILTLTTLPAIIPTKAD